MSTSRNRVKARHLCWSGYTVAIGAAPTDLLTLLEQTTQGHYDHQREALDNLLGRDVADPAPELVEQLRRASPVTHVGNLSPPVMLIHGLQDLQVPASQPLELQQAYAQAG